MPEKIIDNSVTVELSRSFLEYSLSVIVSRALPDVRDGLKPVHRRILYSMYDQGLRPDRPHSKCAKVVGDTMGRFHPHGDSAIYEALVRLAQDWSMRVPVVDPHGNFGSPDDGPAASRYTECRMSHAGAALLDDIREDTVDFEPNYDGTEIQPTVLPSAFPNLLVNGSQGIAVGMATNMAPHNLIEVVAALRAMIENPKITLDEIMEIIPGPDLPTGAIIHQLGGVREAYETGRGAFKMRATARFVDITARKKGIEITELPYQVGSEKVIAKIKELIGLKKLPGITDVKDLTDRKVGLRLLVECKTGFSPAAVLEELYRLTPLEESFSVNAVCLVNGQPETLGLLDLCRHYLAHREQVITRRTQFRLQKAEARAHIIEGLLIALAAIDEVVAVLKASKDTDIARKKLIKTFNLSEIQANHILEMPLRRLVSLEITRLKDEMRELKTTISSLKKILSSKKELQSVISHELGVVAESFGTPRRSQLISVLEAAPVTDLLQEPDEPCLVGLSVSGALARYGVDQPRTGTGYEPQLCVIATSTRQKILAVSQTGRLHSIEVAELPLIQKRGRGNPAGEYAELDSGERLIGLIPANPNEPIAMVTSAGVIKRLDPKQIPTRFPTSIIALDVSDFLVGAMALADSVSAVILSSDAQLLRTPLAKIRPQGRTAAGVAGMKMSPDARVVGFGSDQGTPVVVTLTDQNSVKMTPVSEYPEKGRATGGVRCMRMLAGETSLVSAVVAEPSLVVALDAKSQPLSDKIPTGRRDGSGARLAHPPASLATRLA